MHVRQTLYQLSYIPALKTCLLLWIINKMVYKQLIELGLQFQCRPHAKHVRGLDSAPCTTTAQRTGSLSPSFLFFIQIPVESTKDLASKISKETRNIKHIGLPSQRKGNKSLFFHPESWGVEEVSSLVISDICWVRLYQASTTRTGGG